MPQQQQESPPAFPARPNTVLDALLVAGNQSVTRIWSRSADLPSDWLRGAGADSAQDASKHPNDAIVASLQLSIFDQMQSSRSSEYARMNSIQ